MRQGRHMKEVVTRPAFADIAWAAGIYEGEGTLTMTRKPRWFTFGVSICQKDPWILYKLQQLFGGSVLQRTPAQDGCFYWFAAGARGRGFVQTIFSFLSPRRKAKITEVIQRWMYSPQAIRNPLGHNGKEPMQTRRTIRHHRV